MIKRETSCLPDSAARYGVQEFDLAKKEELLNLVAPIISDLQKGDNFPDELRAFRAGVDSLRFNLATGRLVNEGEAIKIFRKSMGSSYQLNNSFENFIYTHRDGFLNSANEQARIRQDSKNK